MLTRAQRLHLELKGYVVLERAVDASRAEALRERIRQFETRFRAGERDGLEPAFFSAAHQGYFRLDNLPHLDPLFLDYLTDPFLLACVEEAVGGRVRLEQSDAHIRRPGVPGATEQYEFHRGGIHGWGWTGGGLFHYPFVKTLTNLTELGPEDGGTAVIAGSHKLPEDADLAAVIRTAVENPSLIEHVVAPAGSTLLFYESLLHSPGIIRSDRERVLIIGGYTPTIFQAWQRYDPSPELLERVDAETRELLSGESRWAWKPATRGLGES